MCWEDDYMCATVCEKCCGQLCGLWRGGEVARVQLCAVCSHFQYDPKQMERGPIKSRPDYRQTTRAETKKQVRFKNQEDDTVTVRIWTRKSSTGLHGSLTIGNGTSRQTESQV